MIRVASANAASGRGGQGTPSVAAWARDAAELDLVVLAVQEVDHLLERSGHEDQAAMVAAACAAGGVTWSSRYAAAVEGTPGHRSWFRPAGATRPGEPSYGVALLTRLPVRSWQELRMSPSRASLPVPVPGPPHRIHWAPDEPRVAVAAVLEAPGGVLTAVATHLSFDPVRAAGQLREVVRWSASLPRPLVLLGDLNLPGPVPAAVTGWARAGRHPTLPGRTPPGAARPRPGGRRDARVLVRPHRPARRQRPPRPGGRAKRSRG